jgi:hypothetical protein
MELALSRDECLVANEDFKESRSPNRIATIVQKWGRNLEIIMSACGGRSRIGITRLPAETNLKLFRPRCTGRPRCNIYYDQCSTFNVQPPPLTTRLEVFESLSTRELRDQIYSEATTITLSLKKKAIQLSHG